MKPFNFEQFNQHDNEFITLSYKFDSLNGLIIEEESNHVRVIDNRFPANGCDFTCRHYSRSSKDFIEVNESLDINNLFFSNAYNYRLEGYKHCLPENKSIAIANIQQQVNAFVKREIGLMESQIIKLEKTLK